MRSSQLLLTIAALAMSAAQLPAQAPAAPVYYQTVNSIKVLPGKGTEYVKFVTETSMKIAQMRVDAGEIVSWSLSRSVMPAGQEARCDYIISTISEGAPTPPMGTEDFEKRLKKAGINMTSAAFIAQRTTLSTLVSTEMWQQRIRVGMPQKGHYYYLNFMKVLDAAAYTNFETTTWKPLAEEWVKDGTQSGWSYGTKVLPSGTETPYTAYSVDFFPTWEAVFKGRNPETIFGKVHSGKNYQETMAQLPKLRSLARRELWVIVERVAKK